MNLAFFGSPAKLVSYLRSTGMTDEEIFLPVDGLSWGQSYHWMVGHDHPELDDFLREVKFGKPLRIWTISVMTADTEARLIEALDNNFKARLDFVLHSEQKLPLPATINGRTRFVNSLSRRNKSRRPWALDQWLFKLEELARRDKFDRRK